MVIYKPANFSKSFGSLVNDSGMPKRKSGREYQRQGRLIGSIAPDFRKTLKCPVR